MRILLYLAVSLLLLAGCISKPPMSQEAPLSTSKNQENLSLKKEYTEIIDQYKEAALLTDIVPADFPMLNPVSLQMARTYTGEGELDIHSKTLDLNGDGQEELLIGTDTPTGNGELRIHVAIYGLVDGKVVDLTKPFLEAEATNFLALYKHNRLRLDQAKSDGRTVNAVYELTTSGYKELIHIESDASQSSDVEEILIRDREGHLYRSSEVESKLIEVIGYPLDEQQIE